jgi:hypothetical protein
MRPRQKLAYVYFEEEPGRRSAAKLKVAMPAFLLGVVALLLLLWAASAFINADPKQVTWLLRTNPKCSPVGARTTAMGTRRVMPAHTSNGANLSTPRNLILSG